MISRVRSCVEANTTGAARPSSCARSQFAGCDTPSVAWDEAGESVCGHQGAQIVADGLLMIEELGSDHSADRVQPTILGAGRAAAIAIEPVIGSARTALADLPTRFAQTRPTPLTEQPARRSGQSPAKCLR